MFVGRSLTLYTLYITRTEINVLLEMFCLQTNFVKVITARTNPTCRQTVRRISDKCARQ